MIDVNETLAARCNDMGIRWEKAGDFTTQKELKALANVCWWKALDDDDIEDLLEKEFLDNGIYNLDCLQIQWKDDFHSAGELWIVYRRAIDVIEPQEIIFDPVQDNYLLSYSSRGWLEIDGALDLATWTTGDYNPETHEYFPRYDILDETSIADIEDDIENLGLEIDDRVEIYRKK